MWQFIALLVSVNPLSIEAISQNKVGCTDPQWATHAEASSDTHLVATLSSTCQLILEKAGEIRALNKNLMESISTENEVIEGPYSETFQGLPGSFFKVINKSVQNGDRITIHNDVHVAHNENHLVYLSDSTQISGTGNSAYLKKLTVVEEIMTLETGKKGFAFQFKLNQTTDLEKPWFVTKDFFVAQAKSELTKAFKDMLNTVSQDIASKLVSD